MYTDNLSSASSLRSSKSNRENLARGIDMIAAAESEENSMAMTKRAGGVPDEKCHSMDQVKRLIDRLACSDTRVLFQGAFGTGKQYFSHVLHDQSPRQKAPFTVLNCSALMPEVLMEELFGRDGRTENTVFARALGGTLHLAEVQDLPMQLQSQLAYFLEHEFDYKCRLVCSSAMDLAELVRKWKFSEKLYYLISVVTLSLPLLKNRRDEIPALASGLLHACELRSGKSIKLDEAALNQILNYEWPGNVAELRHALEHACALCPGDFVGLEDLPDRVARAGPFPSTKARIFSTQEDSLMPVGLTLEKFSALQEKQFIEETLRFNNGSREKAVAMLGISVSTLYRKLGMHAPPRTSA